MPGPDENSSDTRMTVDDLNREEVIRQIPLIIYLMVISVCGIVGNGLAFHIYRTRFNLSNCVCFVLFLSVTDFSSCCFSIPLEILTLLRQYNFGHAWACQISVFLNTWPTLSSGWLLFVIALDRYRKVCCPFKRQISLTEAKRLCVAAVIYGLLLSWPSPLVYGIYSYKDPKYNLTFTECSTTNEMRETVYPLLNTVMFAVVFSAAVVLICGMYTLIGIHIARHEKRLLGTTIPVVCESCSRDSSVSKFSMVSHLNNRSDRLRDGDSDDIFCSTYDVKDAVNNASKKKTGGNSTETMEMSASTSDLNPSDTITDVITQKTKKSMSITPLPCRHIKQRRAQRTSYIMFLVSLIFVLSYLPLLILLMIRSVSDGFVESLSDGQRAVYKFFLRSYYFNSVINPIIYGIWDARFRQALKEICPCFERQVYIVNS